MYQHACRCGQIYTDDDPDLYKCPACVEKGKLIAQEVDRKIGSTIVPRPMSALEAHLANGKNGFIKLTK